MKKITKKAVLNLINQIGAQEFVELAEYGAWKRAREWGQMCEHNQDQVSIEIYEEIRLEYLKNLELIQNTLDEKKEN